jgi:hypothetical protein
LIGLHSQHWTGRNAYVPFSGAAQQYTPQPGVAMRSDDAQIGLEHASGFDDFRRVTSFVLSSSTSLSADDKDSQIR